MNHTSRWVRGNYATVLFHIIAVGLMCFDAAAENGGNILAPLHSPLAALPSEVIAHEWGTFTYVQGADGAQLEWRTLESSELPSFVYDRNKPGIESQFYYPLITKSGLYSRERMETPVIYFYSPRDEMISVTVSFPQGLITEWYPRARGIGPALAVSPQHPAIKNGWLNWGKIKLLPPALHPELGSQLPGDKSGSHYYAARDTDSCFVRLCTPASIRPAVGPPSPDTYEYEKFLFYRGVGNLSMPLSAVSSSSGVTVSNAGPDLLTGAFLVDVNAGTGSYVSLGTLATGDSRTIGHDPAPKEYPIEEFCARLGNDLRTELVAAGLYPREAAAMVATWKDSWFKEPGTRVLYLLPKPWAERALPLTLSPAPKELVRVMLGRAELITPAVQHEVEQAIVHLGADEFSARQAAEATLRKLGRFAQPALKIAATKSTDAEVRLRAVAILKEFEMPVPR